MTSLDDLVSLVTPFNRRSVWLHFYAGPFLLFYSIWFSIWTGLYGFTEMMEVGCIGMTVLGLLQIVAVLSCHWFVGCKTLMTCVQAKDSRSASLVRVDPMPNNGWSELLPLCLSTDHEGKPILFFTFQKVKYTFDDNKKQFRTLDFPVDKDFSSYNKSTGLDDDSFVREMNIKYGDNQTEMNIPEFWELFKERATAPFFVFQVFCVCLWCLDEYWYYSVFTLMMLVVFEATLVKQQMKNMSEIRNMGNKGYNIQVYRGRKWRPIPSTDLLPGDIVSIGRSVEGQPVPCDLLLLRGPCIVDESMLTGESIPQMKEPIEEMSDQVVFDFDVHSKLHVLFGGTRVVQHSPPPKIGPGLKSPDNGCICYVLRTGFHTAQGKLLRTILFGVKRVTANNLETFGFILFLLIFAIAAAAYVWVKGSQEEGRNKYKLFLECTLILTSVIPPELPIELSLAVNSSLMALTKLGIYCTEPFRIPFAGKISVCAFDKTGTLTTDNLVVEGVAGLGSNRNEVKLVTEIPLESVQVLACCHSLVQLEDEFVGDPLEKACLVAIDWTLTKNDTVIPKRGKQLPLRIFHRNHFSSALKRMSVVAGYIPLGTAEPHHIVAVKGAPETLKIMFSDCPDDYDRIHQKLTRDGARVLAMGFKSMGSLSHQQIKDLSRDLIESALQFVGFVVISCPLKPDSKAMIREIQAASHKTIMITGDHPLTACRVARDLRFTRKEHCLILEPPEDESTCWSWRSIDSTIQLSLAELAHKSKEEVSQYDFCMTGASLSYLNTWNKQFFSFILPQVKVFARVAPKQKEFVITSLKDMGFATLMCGDGTNDVGALKHADVGVALLSHPMNLRPSPVTSVGTVDSSDHSRSQRDTPTMVGGRRVKTRSLAAPVDTRSDAQKRADKLQKLLKEMEEEEKAAVVKLGDASIAAPFTARSSSIQCICHVIKQGRCTLVTTLQMFKILALNALVLAYSQSVLYLDGIKFSDTQATIQGLLLAACFLFVSRSKPLKTLSKQRPLPNIFNLYTLLTVTLQFSVHFVCLAYLVREAHANSTPREGKRDLEEKFKPSLVNSTVYLMSITLQLSTFAVNYRGHPFMESLWENKSLLYSLLTSGGFLLALASGVFPDLTIQLELVEFTPEFRNLVMTILASDLLSCFFVDRVCSFLFGDTRN